MHGRYRLVVKVLVKQAQPVTLNHERILDVISRQASRTKSSILAHDFDSQVAPLGIGLRGILNEQALAATNFDFQRHVASEMRDDMKGLRQFVQRAKVIGQIERWFNLS
jgi:hypothetical protein